MVWHLRFLHVYTIFWNTCLVIFFLNFRLLVITAIKVFNIILWNILFSEIILIWKEGYSTSAIECLGNIKLECIIDYVSFFID